MNINNEKLYIELYNSGKSDLELANLWGFGERQAQRSSAYLRSKGKIKPRQTTQKREKTRFSHSEIVESVEPYIKQVKDVYFKYNDIYKDIKLKTTWTKHKQIEDQVLLLSDMHTGMINKAPITGEVTYNDEIQVQELQSLLKGINRFYQLYKPSYNIETFYIFGLGDLITNDRIFEGQKLEITCGVGAQIQKTFEYVSGIIRKLLELYPRIVYVNEEGNHGRTTPKPNGEEANSNFEYLLGMLIQERFADNKRVEVILPDDYSYTLTIRGHRYLLSHGNAIKGCTLNSIEKAAKEISLLVEQENYDVITIGHFHSCYEFPISPKTTLLVNGCFINKDSYAYYKLRKFSTAKQYLFNVSKRSALHNLQKLDLTWR